MPQMAPMLWTFLMMLFIIVLLTTVVKLYFYTYSCSLLEINKCTSNTKNQWSW
uniref:ATP synthase complex subunit 8 n=1 Tax=Proasellus spelaeus TaxID=1282033 RepID=A0A485MB69_9CRUS|nr:ATP synthase 8 [Proasellus spelaeus]